MTDCIFCKIIRGEIPCDKVYENDKVLAFLDISPVSKGHTLVLPKKHYENLQQIPENLLCDLIKAVKKIAPATLKPTNAPSFNLIVSNGKEAGQEVPHIHMHIIPQLGKDTQINLPHGKYKDSEMEKIADKIRKAL